MQGSVALVHIPPSLHVGVGRHFRHAGPRAATGDTGGLLMVVLGSVPRALVSRALWGVPRHGAGGGVGGAAWDSRLPGNVLVVWPAVAAVDGRAGQRWIVHPAVDAVVFVVLVLVLVLVGGGETACCAEGAELGVAVLAILAGPELSLAGAGGVVVGWGRAVALLSLVGAGEGDLEGG